MSAIALGALGLGFGRADESSGTWTGNVQLRTNYYWETSTRVLAPEVRARLDSPGGVGVSAGYLVDAITSASIAAGVIADIRFTEVRNQGRLGIDREFDLGDAQLMVALWGYLSHEPDYFASSFNFITRLSFDQRNTELRLELGHIHDSVGSVIRGADRMTGAGNLSNRGRVDQMEAFRGRLMWSQVLSPEMTLLVGYDFRLDQGLQSNPYRAVMVQGVLRPEEHPEERHRHALYGRLAYFITPTRTALHLTVRGYADSWDVFSIDPEIRVYQLLGEEAMLRLRYRYYQQTAAYFWEAPGSYEGDATYVTADPKMEAFRSHLIGAHLRLSLRFLSGSFLDFLHAGSFDMSFDYYLQGNRFGDAVISQAGVAVPF